jgi:hypothetical protein
MDREKLYQYYRSNLVRFASDSSVKLDWMETGLEINKNIRSQVDDRILKTQVNPNTRAEIIEGYIEL